LNTVYVLLPSIVNVEHRYKPKKKLSSEETRGAGEVAAQEQLIIGIEVAGRGSEGGHDMEENGEEDGQGELRHRLKDKLDCWRDRGGLRNCWRANSFLVAGC
jgi:hypothetical protein